MWLHIITSLDKCPAFDSFDDKILLRGQRFIGIGAARLRATLIQITVQPQTEFTAAIKPEFSQSITIIGY